MGGLPCRQGVRTNRLHQAGRPAPMRSFFRKVGIDPRTEPGFVLAPAQALADEDLADPAAAHGDALFGQIGDQAVQGPRRKRQAQFGWAGQGGGDDGAALLGRVSRRPSGAYILLQPIQSPRVEAVQPVAHRVAAQIHPGGDLLRLQAVHGIDNNLGTADERGSKRVGTCDPLHLRPLMIIQLPHSKGHGPAPKPMAMSPQHRSQPAISNDLPDAPLNPVYFENRSFSSLWSRWYLTHRRSAMVHGSWLMRASNAATRRVRSSAVGWQ